LTVTIPSIEEGQAPKSWLPHPSMEEEINGYCWASLALSEAFQVTREYDTYFVIAPYKVEYRIPVHANERFALILGANCIPGDKLALKNYFHGLKGMTRGGKQKVRVILGYFKPLREIMQGIETSLWKLGQSLQVSFNQYDDVMPKEFTAFTFTPEQAEIEYPKAMAISENDMMVLNSKLIEASGSPSKYNFLYTLGFQ
jgi:hypothetical protein